MSRFLDGRTKWCMLLALTALGSVAPSDGKGLESIDLGSPDPVQVQFFGDPRTLLRIPPGAFGTYPPGTLATIQLEAATCSDPSCVAGQGVSVFFDGRYSGDLVRPVVFQIGYDEELLELYGSPEEETVIAWYDWNARRWVPFAEQQVDPDLNVVQGVESQNINRLFAYFAGTPQPVEPSTWGGIKAIFEASR